MNKNVLIIGGAGFIGRHIVSQLDALGADICVLDITSRPKDISCLLYTSPSPRDRTRSRMPSSA